MILELELCFNRVFLSEFHIIIVDLLVNMSDILLNDSTILEIEESFVVVVWIYDF